MDQKTKNTILPLDEDFKFLIIIYVSFVPFSHSIYDCCVKAAAFAEMYFQDLSYPGTTLEKMAPWGIDREIISSVFIRLWEISKESCSIFHAESTPAGGLSAGGLVQQGWQQEEYHPGHDARSLSAKCCKNGHCLFPRACRGCVCSPQLQREKKPSHFSET